MLATAPEVQSSSRAQRSEGRGVLSVKLVGGASRIENLRQQGCAKIRVPKNPGHGMEAVMINSSGGMTGGDKLDWEFEAGQGTELTVTTQACERVYEAIDGQAQTKVHLNVGENAKLAWLPQETILFNRSAYSRTIDVELGAASELLMVETYVFGRGAMGEVLHQASVRDRWRVRRGDALVHAEELQASGEVDKILAGVGVTSGQHAVATALLIAPRGEGLFLPVRDLLATAGAASFWNDKLLIRLAAPTSYALREKLLPLINLLSGDAMLPKVWKI